MISHRLSSCKLQLFLAAARGTCETSLPLLFTVESARADLKRPKRPRMGLLLQIYRIFLTTTHTAFQSISIDSQALIHHQCSLMAHLTSRHGTGYSRLDGDGALYEVGDSSARPERTSISISPFSHESASEFDAWRQTSSTLKRQSYRWLVTASILAASLAMLRIYERMGNVNSAQKNICSNLMTALILLLGLNFFVSQTWYHTSCHEYTKADRCSGSL